MSTTITPTQDAARKRLQQLVQDGYVRLPHTTGHFTRFSAVPDVTYGEYGNGPFGPRREGPDGALWEIIFRSHDPGADPRTQEGDVLATGNLALIAIDLAALLAHDFALEDVAP